MTLWPYSPGPVWASHSSEEDWQALVVPGVGGVRQVREQLTSPVRRVALAYRVRAAELDLFEQVVRACRGPAVAFGLHLWDKERMRRDLAIGTGDGTTGVWEIPFGELYRTDFSPVVTVGGAARTENLHYWFGVENRIRFSEDFSSGTAWVNVAGETVTRTSGQADPLGGTNGWRLQGNGAGGTTNKLYQVVASGLPAAGATQRTSVWVKNNSGAVVAYIVDGITVQTAPTSSGWTEYVFSNVASGANGGLIQFSVPMAANVLDVTVWHPGMAYSNSLWGVPDSTWGYLPTLGAGETYSTNRDLHIGFAYGFAPGAAAAIVLSAAGRYFLPSVALVGPKWVVVEKDIDLFEFQVDLEEVV